MKRMTKTVAGAFLLSTLMFTTACNKDDDKGNDNVTTKNTTVKGVIESESQFSLMNEAIEESNNSEFFSNSSANVTLFAANNDAFNDLFAEVGVSSMTELKTQLGDEQFSNVILYHAINGNFNLDGFNDGFNETNASNDDGDNIDVLIQSQSSSSVFINGNDENGAQNVGSSNFAATNGSVIEVDAVIRAQSNFENVDEGESENALFIDLLVDGNLESNLSDNNEESTVLVMNDAQVETLLSIRLRDVLDRDDFANLLDANAQSTLFAELGVNTLDELIANVTLTSMLNLNTVSLTDIFNEMESNNKADLVGTLVIDGNFDKDDMTNAGSITSRAGVQFSVVSDSSGNLVLTDNDGNTILLDGNSTTTANGSIFVVSDVSEM